MKIFINNECEETKNEISLGLHSVAIHLQQQLQRIGF
jgi:hypothetical protein